MGTTLGAILQGNVILVMTYMGVSVSLHLEPFGLRVSVTECEGRETLLKAHVYAIYVIYATIIITLLLYTDYFPVLRAFVWKGTVQKLHIINTWGEG